MSEKSLEQARQGLAQEGQHLAGEYAEHYMSDDEGLLWADYLRGRIDPSILDEEQKALFDKVIVHLGIDRFTDLARYVHWGGINSVRDPVIDPHYFIQATDLMREAMQGILANSREAFFDISWNRGHEDEGKYEIQAIDTFSCAALYVLARERQLAIEGVIGGPTNPTVES